MIPKPDVAVTPEIPGIATEVGVVKDTRAKTGIPDVISAEIDILAMTTVTPDIPVETGNKLEIPAGPPIEIQAMRVVIIVRVLITDYEIVKK